MALMNRCCLNLDCVQQSSLVQRINIKGVSNVKVCWVVNFLCLASVSILTHNVGEGVENCHGEEYKGRSERNKKTWMETL